jgi:hypothetical protein
MWGSGALHVSLHVMFVGLLAAVNAVPRASSCSRLSLTEQAAGDSAIECKKGKKG